MAARGLGQVLVTRKRRPKEMIAFDGPSTGTSSVNENVRTLRKASA